MNSPPEWAAWLIAVQLPAAEREGVLGDLAERFSRRGRVYGWGQARRWYWREVLSFLFHISRYRLGESLSGLKRSIQMSSLGSVFATIVQDVRYGLRVLASRPAFTSVAVLVLALGIGANSAIFTLVNELLLRPRPSDRGPGQLVGLYSKDRVQPDRYRTFSYPNYVDIREQNDVFSHLLAQGIALVGVTEGDATHRTMALAVSANFFETLGARLTIGRAFTEDEERPGYPERVAVVSHGYWERHGSDPGTLGGSIVVNGRDYTIVGITARGFTGSAVLIAPEVYVPLSAYELIINDLFTSDGGPTELADRENHALLLIGRLQPGLNEDHANSRLEALGTRMEQAYPVANKDQTLFAHRLRRVGISTSPGGDTEVYAVFGMLQAMAVVVLLIACLNLANMLLARAGARRKEVGIRIALGAGRTRIVRQFLIEGFLLSLAGGAAGLLLAFTATRAIADAMTGAIPIAIAYDGTPDMRVLLATLCFAAGSTLMFALWPAMRLSRTDVVSELKQLVPDGGSRRWLTARHALVVGQVALSLALLTGGGLFVKSAVDAARADPGFEFRDGIVASVDPGLIGYDKARGRELYRELLSRVRALPQVRAASLASLISFGDFSESNRVRRLGADTDEATTSGVSNIVGSDYFASLGLSVLRGREFTRGEEESAEAPPVAIIDEPLARELFPDEEPLGQQIVFVKRDDTLMGPPAEIVGIAPGLRHDLYDREPEPHVYVPFGQRYRSGMLLHVKTTDGGRQAELATLALLRGTVRAVDDRIPILWLKTLESYHQTSLMLWVARAGALMFSVFGVLALLLAAIGLYGVKAYLVTLRTREIGIRIALGAAPRDVLWMVVRDSLVLTGLGVVLGLALAGLVAMAVTGMVYQQSPYDPSVFGGAVVLLSLAALVATYVPARRATQVQPSTALRVD